MKSVLFSNKAFARRRSIRWRLPLSYAGIALLTALALGGLLLFTLNRYYDHREQEYLRISAEMLARQTGRMYSDALTNDDIQLAVAFFSVLTRTRVQWFDTGMQMIADSGPMDEQPQINIGFSSQEFAGPVVVGGTGVMSEPSLSLYPNPYPAQEPSFQKRTGRYFFETRRDPFGQFITDGGSPGEYSNQRVTEPVYGLASEVVGYLTLSEGPAFGSEIVGDVAESSIIAGGAALLIAALVGVFISRNISRPVLALADTTRQMSQGNLAARVQLTRQDEFGLLAEAFNTMAARVEDIVSTLRHFVADAAHEINTPLTALRTNLELTASFDMPPSARTDIERALAELRRLEMLTRSLLTLAWLEAPNAPVQRASVELTPLVQQMHERYASRAEQAEIALAVVVPEDPVCIQADRGQIIRLLDNLLDNALKFTPSTGSVTLGLRVVEPAIARLWVQDTGIGIPESDLPNLFGRFHRGRNAAAYPGNGLGLVIAKAIVEEHGGQIAVASDSAGTCFTVDLPISSG